MIQVRTIWSWLTLLLFMSGIGSPLAPAVRAACPMMQAAQAREHCEAAKPKPEPAPVAMSCCAKREAAIEPTSEISAGCCCHLSSAPERTDTPAVLPLPSTVTTVPTAAVELSLPQTVTVTVVASFAVDENAPRGPPRVFASPRAPPLS